VTRMSGGAELKNGRSDAPRSQVAILGIDWRGFSAIVVEPHAHHAEAY
jgi:hypothetical protein